MNNRTKMKKVRKMQNTDTTKHNRMGAHESSTLSHYIVNLVPLPQNAIIVLANRVIKHCNTVQ